MQEFEKLNIGLNMVSSTSGELLHGVNAVFVNNESGMSSLARVAQDVRIANPGGRFKLMISVLDSNDIRMKNGAPVYGN